MAASPFYVIAPTQMRAHDFAAANMIGNAVYYSYDKARFYLRGCRIERAVFIGDPPEDVWLAIQPALREATEVYYAC
jgi:hypothetical protein